MKYILKGEVFLPSSCCWRHGLAFFTTHVATHALSGSTDVTMEITPLRFWTLMMPCHQCQCRKRYAHSTVGLVIIEDSSTSSHWFGSMFFYWHFKVTFYCERELAFIVPLVTDVFQQAILKESPRMHPGSKTIKSQYFPRRIRKT